MIPVGRSAGLQSLKGQQQLGTPLPCIGREGSLSGIKIWGLLPKGPALKVVLVPQRKPRQPLGGLCTAGALQGLEPSTAPQSPMHMRVAFRGVGHPSCRVLQ